MPSLKNHVLPEDVRLATDLYNCCYSSLNRASLELELDNLEQAEKWVAEFQRCKRDLDKLHQRKVEADQLARLIQLLIKNGVAVETLRREAL